MIKHKFSRESVMWMPVTELNDYISLINAEIEKENTEMKISEEKENNSNSDFLSTYGKVGQIH